MQRMQGLMHQTSTQGVYDTEHSYSIAGQKRSHQPEDGDFARPKPLGQAPVLFQRAVYLPNAPSRLSPSKIADFRGSLGISEYSQRKEFSATPSSTRDAELDLKHPIYALPPKFVTNFAALGIQSIYPWQKNCLKGPGLLDGTKNLVYSAPTGGGKSLIADLLMIKRIIETPGGKALLILPYVALVQEKVRWLRQVVEGFRYPENSSERDTIPAWKRRLDKNDIRVIGFFGGGKIKSTWDDFDIGVCTLEKANSLINTAVEDCSIKNLRAVVLDELHMIDDEHRGYIIELIGAKLLSVDHSVQIIGMSATISNISLMAQWLNAHSYETRYRPIPIEEHIVCNGSIYDVKDAHTLLDTTAQLNTRGSCEQKAKACRKVLPSTLKELADPVLNAVVSLTHETAMNGYGVLVFAGSRGMCEADARIISRVMPPLQELDETIRTKRLEILDELRSLSTGLDHVLEETILFGVAFHHILTLQAGLTSEEREIIAEGFDSGTLLVCVATCSLAAGINLPARRVILHNAKMGRDYVAPAMLRQMRGRAGRQGKSPIGETYLCCRQDDLEQVVSLIESELPQVISCLNAENRRIQRAVLEIITVRLATNTDSIRFYFSKSLLAFTHEPEQVTLFLKDGVNEIETMGLVEQDADGDYSPTQLGKAIVASAIDPDDGVFVHQEMVKTLRAFVMDGEMHILYVFTPVQDFGITVNWQVFRNEVLSLDDSGMRVLNFLGMKPTVIERLAQGATLPEKTKEEKDLARVYRRFYLALQLKSLCNEVPVHVVARRFDTPRGIVQSLSQTCQGFAAGMVKFCEHMDWGVMSAALDHYSDRLLAGARTELLALAQIPFIKSRTARVFWDNGFRSIASIANTDPKELVPILIQAQPNKLRLNDWDSEKFEEKLLMKAQIISNAANRLWNVQMQAEMGLE